MSDGQIYTYWRKNGAVYKGDQTNIDLESHDPTYAKLGSIKYDSLNKKFNAKKVSN